jgi:hypothetical protein
VRRFASAVVAVLLLVSGRLHQDCASSSVILRAMIRLRPLSKIRTMR